MAHHRYRGWIWAGGVGASAHAIVN
jgi:hypothetical protein